MSELNQTLLLRLINLKNKLKTLEKERILELLDIIEPNIGLLSDAEAREVESLVSKAIEKYTPREIIYESCLKNLEIEN